MMALQAGAGISFGELREVIGEMLDVVVRLERSGEERRIVQVHTVRT